jgi:hypothetical protein
LDSRLEASPMHTFAFERAEKRLGHGIIVAVGRAAYAHGGTNLCEEGSVGITSTLRLKKVYDRIGSRTKKSKCAYYRTCSFCPS